MTLLVHLIADGLMAGPNADCHQSKKPSLLLPLPSAVAA